MTRPAPRPPAPIWKQAASEALDDVLDWLGDQPWGDPEARLAEVHVAAWDAAQAPEAMPVRARIGGRALRWWQASDKLLVVYVYEPPPGEPGPGQTYIVHVAHADRAERLPDVPLRRALREIDRLTGLP